MKKNAASVTRKIDILICNAGFLNGYGGLEDKTHNSSAIENLLMTNVVGVFFTARSFLPHLIEKNIKTNPQSSLQGKLSVISSIMGSQARAGSSAPIYRASKAAATNLMRSLAIEPAPRGVAVGAYYPGWMRTDMGGSSANVSPQESTAGLLNRFNALNLANTGLYESYSGEQLPV